MQIINTEITLYSLFFILIIITIITIINYNYSSNHLSALYILAEPDNNNNDNKEEKGGIENDKDKKKVEKKIKKQEKSSEEEEYGDSLSQDNSWTRADKDLLTKYNYRNLAILKIYQNAPDGETYRESSISNDDEIQNNRNNIKF